MRATSMAPRLHFFVCANRRPSDSPLGPGCADAGDALFDALKAEVALRRQFTAVWVTKTACLGICPREGATLGAYTPTKGGHIYTEAQVSDAAYLYETELSAADAAQAKESRMKDPSGFDALEALLVGMEELQIRKVFELARRLKPGITHEDMRNPHDFPELHDTDWHFEDGILTGIQSVLSAIRARHREIGP